MVQAWLRALHGVYGMVQAWLRALHGRLTSGDSVAQLNAPVAIETVHFRPRLQVILMANSRVQLVLQAYGCERENDWTEAINNYLCACL